MKKVLISHIILLYIAQLSVSLAVVLFFNNVSANIYSVFMCAGLVLYIIATLLGIISFALSATLMKNTNKLNYKFLMIAKLCMIPYFVFNFVQCFLLVAGFLNPFLFLSLIFIVPILIGLTYISLLPTTLASTFLTIGYVKNKEVEFENIIVWQILEYLFVLDVISSIILFGKFQNNLKINIKH